MNVLLDSFNHFMHQFDGFFHLCFLVSVFIFIVGALWVFIRILIPLWDLSIEITNFTNGKSVSFRKPGRGIAEIEELRKTLQQMTSQLKAAEAREVIYRNALIDSQENERKRIAREIHDDTIQSLVLVAHSIERAAQAVNTSENLVTGHLENARSQLVAAIDNLRQMIANLRPTILDELGLAAAIEVLCEKYQSVEFSIIGDVYGLNQTHELAVFRAAQEAIYNAQRHAQAKHIVTTLIYSAAAVTLEVSDDGVGFQIPTQLQEFSAQGHYGLIGISERILHLGGKLNLISQSAIGTRVTVKVPTTQTSLFAA